MKQKSIHLSIFIKKIHSINILGEQQNELNLTVIFNSNHIYDKKLRRFYKKNFKKQTLLF